MARRCSVTRWGVDKAAVARRIVQGQIRGPTQQYSDFLFTHTFLSVNAPVPTGGSGRAATGGSARAASHGMAKRRAATPPQQAVITIDD
jgi:hypothetical protein